jgi:hypothetical protein
MKHLFPTILIVLLLGNLTGCAPRDKSKILEKYKYEASTGSLNEALQKKVGSWIQEGMTCYGILILTDENGLPKRLKEIKAKVISIEKDKIKMKSLEDIALAPVKGCTKMGMKKGETWDETEGDLFLTKDEAIKFIDTNYPDMRLNN